MTKQILAVHDSHDIANRINDATDQFHITHVASGKDGLEALTRSAGWCSILAASQLPDMSGIAFLEKAAALSAAVPLLLIPDTQLTTFIHQANKHSVFRIVPENSPTNILEIIIEDAARQFRRIQQEWQLQERIKQLTIIDPLTGCYSRTHLQEWLKKELNRSIRCSHYLSIILCDIDTLENINKAFGHHVGDQLLTGFSQTAMQSIRQDIDTVTRWGEDEFLVVLPETPIRDAGRVAMRLCEQFANMGYTANGHPVNATASFGVAGFAPEFSGRNTEPEDLVLFASRCLHQAKATGGNQVLCCP